MRGPELVVRAALTMSHTQRGLKDRELMYGLMLILITRILMKVSHLYKESVASYWACSNIYIYIYIFFFFPFSEKVGHDTKESSLSTTLFTGYIQFVSSFFLVCQNVIAITSFLNLLVLEAYNAIFILPPCANFSLK